MCVGLDGVFTMASVTEAPVQQRQAAAQARQPKARATQPQRRLPGYLAANKAVKERCRRRDQIMRLEGDPLKWWQIGDGGSSSGGATLSPVRHRVACVRFLVSILASRRLACGTSA
jgi:hypothetical protein